MSRIPIILALDEVRKTFPDVICVIFDPNGDWLYLNSNGNAPDFTDKDISYDILKDASNAAFEIKGFPSIYYHPDWDK